MSARQTTAVDQAVSSGRGRRGRPLDSYGIVLLLIVLDYIAMSLQINAAWARIAVVVLLGVTLLFALRTSQARRIWQTLALVYLLASTAVALASELIPGVKEVSQQLAVLGGLLLLITPVAIGRRIATHRVVTTETVMGAICVYLLIGFSFAFIFAATSALSSMPFFAGQAQTTFSNYLFFSYTTLTTVGYGNLVPAGNLGQTFAMLEALSGQIYLVIVVARLVSLWGQERPTRASLKAGAVDAQSADPDGGSHPAAGEDAQDRPQ